LLASITSTSIGTDPLGLKIYDILKSAIGMLAIKKQNDGGPS